MAAESPSADQRVLLLAPTSRDGQTTRGLLAAAGIECLVCTSMEQLCAEADIGAAALVVPEEVVLSDESDRLAHVLHRQPVWSDVPIIVLSRSGAESAAVEKALATLGNVSLIERPMRVSTLLSVIRAALRARERQFQIRDHLQEMQRVEGQLRHSEARLAAIFEQSTAGIAKLDTTGQFVLVNQWLCDLLGYHRHELLAMRMQDITHPDDRERNRVMLEKAEREHGTFVIEKRYLRKDGSPVWVSVSVSIVRDEYGNSYGALGIITDLTERKRTEERLALDAMVLSNVQDSVIVTDLHGIVTFWNEGATRLFGWTAKEMVGRPLTDRMPESSRLEVAAWIERIASGQAEFEGEWLDRRKDGSPVWIEARTRRIADAAGNPIGIMGVSRDISARKLADVRDRFLLQLDDAVRPLTDADEITTTAAKLLGEHLGVDRCAYADIEADEDTMNLTGNYLRDPAIKSIVGRMTFTDFGAEVLKLMREGAPYVVHDIDRHEPRVENVDAYRATQIQAVICVPLHKGGRFVAAMAVHSATPRQWTPEEVSLVQTVANRCWESIERARVGRSLRESEAKFRHLAETIPQLAWMANADGWIFWYNRRFYDYTGTTPQAMEGWGWKSVHDPAQLPAVLERWQHSIRTGEPFEMEFPIRSADGTFRWFLTRVAPFRDADGTILLWFGTNTDIEDRRRIADERAQLLEAERDARSEAERTSRMKDEFLATLSHELRTPLNAILGWSQILASGTKDAQDLSDGLRTIERNARAQAQIIEDLLDMSRIISGKIRLDVQQIDLTSVVYAAVETVKPAADAKGIHLKTVLDPSAGPVSGDSNRLQQVMWNLLTNAVKFTPKGGRVQVLLERVNSHIEMSVVDTGEGIKPEFLPYVFDRFRQADASTTRRHGGLGLGLAIVKQLVELHGGTVRVNSSGAGTGTTFVVSLPVSAVHREPAGTPEHRRHPVAPPAHEPPPDTCLSLAEVRVLVVDDEADSRTLVRRLLEDCNAVVRTASSASEALALLRAETPDVLVSDIGMPGQDGYALIKQVRALGAARGGDVPALALTAYARSEDRMRSVIAGFQMHIAKPVEPAELITMVASLAGKTAQPTNEKV